MKLFKISKAFIPLLSLLLTVSCNHKESEFSESEIISFPTTLDLTDIAPLPSSIPSFGIMDLRVVDSMLLVSVDDNRDFWHIYSLPSLEKVDSLLSIGGGPGETDMPVPASYVSEIRNKAGKTIIAFPTIINSKMVLIDEKSGNNNLSYGIDTILEIPVERNSLITYMLDEDRILNYKVIPEQKRVLREIIGLSVQKNHEIPLMEYLNKRHVDDMSEIFEIITIPAIQPGGRMIVEIPGFMNEQYLYDTKTGNGKKIIYPGLKNNVSNLRILSDKRPIFGSAYGHEDYFTYLRYENQENGKVKTFMDFVDWNGNPLGSILLPDKTIRCADISEKNGLLICIDADLEGIMCYNISDFLKKIKSNFNQTH